MRVDEARVLILAEGEDRNAMADLVSATGGKVLRLSAGANGYDVYDQMHVAFAGWQFPAGFAEESINKLAGAANVVLFGDWVQQKEEKEGQDNNAAGRRVFDVGYQYGLLHPANVKDGIGALAVSCSRWDSSSTAALTAANVRPERNEEAERRWSRVLEAHPADPTYLKGQIERWRENGNLRALLRPLSDSGDGDNLTVHTLVRNISRNDAPDHLQPVYTNSSLWQPNNAVDLEELIHQAETEKPQKLLDCARKLEVGKRLVRAVVQAGDDVYVVKHSLQTVDGLLGPGWNGSGGIDRIALGSVARLPSSYWQEFGLKPPASVMSQAAV